MQCGKRLNMGTTFSTQLTELSSESGEREASSGTPVERHDEQALLGLSLSPTSLSSDLWRLCSRHVRMEEPVVIARL